MLNYAFKNMSENLERHRNTKQLELFTKLFLLMCHLCKKHLINPCELKGWDNLVNYDFLPTCLFSLLRILRIQISSSWISVNLT